MADFNKLRSALSLRRMPKGGPNRSDDINDSLEEILHDLAELYHFVNNTIIPVFNGLGAAGTYSDVNVVTMGLDGKSLITDNDWTDTGNVFFYNVAQGRPKTVKETTLRLSQDVDTLYRNINQIRARLGSIDQDENTNPATLAEIENQLNYFIGVVNTLQSNTTGYLTASGIAAAIAAQTIDPSSFNIGRDDITLNAGIRPTDISGIDLTQDYVYTGGVPGTYDLEDTIYRLKEFVEDTCGDSIVTFAGSGLSGDSLKTHREKVGTGTVSATNPHGLDVANLDDSTGITARTTLIAEFDIKTSGLGTDARPHAGGYFFAPAAYTVSQVAGTAVDGATSGITLGIYRRRSAANALIYSGLAVPAATPGSASAAGGFTNTDIQAGDLIFISGMVGDGIDGKVFVWGTPA